MTILQQPDALSFSMNLKPFKISATADVVFSLSQGDAVLLSQILSPDADGQVEISLRDVIHDRLSCQVPPTADPYQQSSVAADFTAVIDGQSVTFRVIRGGVDRLSGTVTDFLKANFLTWQPNVKPVTYSSPEFLSYYAVSSGCSLKVKAWFTDASGNATAGATKTICSLTKGVVTTVSVQYAVIAGLYAGSLPAYYDVWVASGSTALTYTQRYYANVMQSEEEQWIFFENSLGGIDTFRTFGAVSLDAEHTHHIAEIDDVAYEYRVDTERKWTVNTGHLDILERRWLLDFFPSAGKYVYAGSAVRRIVLTEDSVSYRFRELPSSYSFTFRFAEALPLLNLPRHELPVEMLDITVPDIGSFTLPPRLLEFSRLPLSEGVLFPVQSPYAEEWGVATLAGIAQYVSSLIDIPSPGISRNDIIRLLSAQLTPLDPLHPEDSLIDPSWLPESYGGTTDISHVAGLQNALDTLTGQLSNKLDVRFFNSIFTVYDSDGNAIVPNTYTQVADNLRILVGTWTDEYLSALGKNPSGGGSGGTGSVNSILVSSDYYDSDENGIVDLSAAFTPYAKKSSLSSYLLKSDISAWAKAASKPSYDLSELGGSLAWDKVSSTPKTLSGYGITDAAIANGEITLGNSTITPVTSVAMSVPTGFSVSGSPVSKTGTLELSYASGYEGFTTALKNKINLLYSLFTREGSGTSADPYVIKANYGLYTDDFLSALGKNPSGGGSGGTGSVNSIKVAANVFRDPDSDGIIDLTADIVSSADRTRWNAAATNSHTHSNKSVLDGITAGKVSSWDAVASIMGSDSDTVINKWNEVVAFLDTYTEADTLANLLSNKLDVRFFNSIFTVYDSDGNAIVPNTYTQVADNLRILVGTWTDEYLSALGKNPSGGGSGGTGSVNSILVSSDYYDSDENGIVDLSAAFTPYAKKSSLSSYLLKSDISAWAKAASKPSYDLSELGGSLAWDKVSSTPKTLSGYGITDAAIANGEITLGNSTITPVTSVAMSVPTGFSVSGSPVSKTGTLELSYASGYEGFTTALKNKINLLYSLFTREGSGTSADPYVIKANYGLYTDDFLSALGKNPSGGGSGGTGSVNSIKVAANVFRDPDSDGIIDLTADIVSSADRTRWNAAATNSHTHSNKSVLDGITAGKVSSWDAVASIMGSDSDTVINKWNEVVAFLDTYTEADTLANLLSNKADKSDVYSASTSRTKNYVLAAPSSQNGAASFRKLVSADIPDLSSSYATASRATALEGYFTNGVAKTAAKLSTVSKTAWGKTFWTSGGVPQDVDGTLTISGGELMIWNTADTSAENRWDMRFAWSGEIFQMWAYEDAYHDLSIGSTAAATATYKGLYYDASEKRWGIGTSTPAYTLDVKGPIATTGAITLAGTTEAARRIYFGDTSHYIELDADGYFHFSHGLYSDSFVSALGKNPSGGGSGTGSFDEESMWTALGTTVSAKVIAASHIPSLAASKITSGTLAAARIPALAIAKISGLQDALDNVYTKTASDGRYYALYGGTDLSPSSSKAVDLNTILDTGSYFISNASNAKYVSNRPVTGGHDFRLWVTATTGTSANYKRQRYARYDNNNVYERYTTNGGTSWSTWELVQDNLANYASASSLDGYLPLSGGTMNNGVAICWKDNPSSGTASDLSLVSFSTTNNFHLGYDAATFGYNTYINGNQVYLRYGSSRTVGLTLSSEGAVSIANGLGTGSYIDVDRSHYGAVSLGYQLNVLRARCKNAGTGTFAYNSVISLFGSGETGTTVNNLGVRLGSQSGATWISAGESGKTLSSKYTDMCNTGSVYITADNQIKFFTNCSNDGTSFTDAATINSSWDLTVARYVYATTFHGALSGNATTATTATKLSTVSKTAWGQTYWTSGGIPTNISGNLSSVDNIYMANAKTIFIKDTDGTDRSILNLSSNNNVNLGYGAYNLGTGTYIYGKTLVVRIGGTSSTYNALSIDAEKDATFAGSVTASSFIGNASTATTLKTARSIWGQSFNGGAAVNGTLFMISGEEGSTVNTASAKLKFNSHNTNETMRSPYIQGVGGSSYGRKRLGFFQSNATNYTDDFVEAMSIMPTGRVGIGTTAPSYLLHVNGTMAGKECRALSDIRRKDIIGEIHISVADIAAAPSILFTWKDGTDKAVHGGTTAQYWQPIAQCYVNEGDDGALDLNYAGLALSASIENSKLLLTHDTEIELLKKENRELKMRVRKLERRVA